MPRQFIIVCNNDNGEEYFYQRGSAMGFRRHEQFATRYDTMLAAYADKYHAKRLVLKSLQHLVKVREVV